MTDRDLKRARESFRADGTVESFLVEELERVATGFVRFEHFPPSYAPYGEWNEEAGQELLQGWLAEKLLGSGGLAALLDRAGSASAFRRLAQLSLRQYVLNSRTRSQAQNLYTRAAQLLQAADSPYAIQHQARRPQDAVWRLEEAPRRAAFAGGDRQLLSLAWSLGEFELIRYRADAAKLSPLLSTEELERFISGMLERGGPMSLTQLMRALALRFDLAEVELVELEAGEQIADPMPVDEASELRHLALAVIRDLNQRQATVLLETRAGETIEAISSRLGCSSATVFNEQKRIAEAIRRYGHDRGTRDKVLKKVGDLLYEGMENP